MSLALARAAWQKAAPVGLRRLAGPAIRKGLRAYVHAQGRPGAWVGADPLPLRLVGLPRSSHGIAASLRLAVRAFERLGAAVEVVDAGAGFDPGLRLRDPAPAVWMFHLNAPELAAALASLGPRRVRGLRYGVWAWELPAAPASWLKDAAWLDEVWAPSRYVAGALATARAPIRVTPHPLDPDDYTGVEPAPRRSAFRAVAMFDFNSSAARKNPQGAAAAFQAAFGDDPACELVIKTQNGAAHPAALAGLRAAAPPNVRIIDETWPYAQVKALIAGADVLISLHRAEGFGLALAEAMALGTPVMATAASGEADFFDETCGLVVPSHPVPVVDPQGIYRGQTWGEPDIGAAAAALRRLRDEPDLRASLAAAGRARVRSRLSPEAWLGTLPAPVQASVAAYRSGLLGV